jgi:peptidoglycan/xylan/chitin deacetylase (PgdA/CDA1 family)
VTFDDGYRSAAEYVGSRAPRQPDVEWLLFVCPEKIEKRAGFRWDLFEWRRRQGEAGAPFADVMNERHDITTENDRPDLRGLADRAEFGLVTVDEARALQRHPNVQVGNHGNSHFKPTRLDEDAFRSDLTTSFATFERLFGPAEHYAFPFGFPGLEFGPRHVQIARECTRAVLWTTLPGPYPPGAQRSGALLPRFPIDGRRPPRQTAAWALLVTARRRLRRSWDVRLG